MVTAVLLLTLFSSVSVLQPSLPLGDLMRVAFLTAIRRLEIREAPDPGKPGAGEVLLHVDTVGVCGSDVHYYNTGRIGSAVVKFPERLGHECAGTVVEAGEGVTALRTGDRVAVDPLIFCGECDQCRTGHENLCRRQRFLGHPGQAPGALAEYLLMPAVCCYPVPESMDQSQAAMVEPFSIGVYAQRLAKTQPGSKIAILGSGPIGLSVLLACRAASEAAIYSTDLRQERLEAAECSGAVWSGNPRETDVVSAIKQHEPEGIDCAFECAGEQETLDQALEILKPGGRLMIVGIPEVDAIRFNPHTLRRKEIAVLSVRRQNRCTGPAIDLIANGVANVDPLVTHHFPLSEADAAHDLVARYADGVIKAMIHIP